MRIDFTYRRSDERPAKKPKLTAPGLYPVVIRNCNHNVDPINGEETLWVNFDTTDGAYTYSSPFHISGTNTSDWDAYNFSRLLDACGIRDFYDTDVLTGKTLLLKLDYNKDNKLKPSYESNRTHQAQAQNFDAPPRSMTSDNDAPF